MFLKCGACACAVQGMYMCSVCSTGLVYVFNVQYRACECVYVCVCVCWRAQDRACVCSTGLVCLAVGRIIRTEVWNPFNNMKVYW